MNAIKISVWYLCISSLILSSGAISSNAGHHNGVIHFSTIAHADSSVFYAHAGDQDKTGLLFIHGTPGSWNAFEWYLSNPDLQEDYFIVSIDRPGWGESMIDVDFDVSSFSAHSAVIGAIFEQYPGKEWILVGHSLGASIAPQIAADYPDRVTGLLLLAGSLSPKLGSPRWYNRAANTWVVSKLIGTEMKKSNREIMALRTQLSAMDEKIKQAKLNTNVIILQGKKDRLVSPKNPQYALDNWTPHFSRIRAIELEDEGHFLPWRQSSLIVELIEQLDQKQQ